MKLKLLVQRDGLFNKCMALIYRPSQLPTCSTCINKLGMNSLWLSIVDHTCLIAIDLLLYLATVYPQVIKASGMIKLATIIIDDSIFYGPTWE